MTRRETLVPNYKAGDTIGKYALIDDLHVANGGNCKWAFARYGGKSWFVKEFFAPKYPVKKMGSEATMKAKRENCERFEAHQRLLMKRAGEVAGEGGRLVVPTDFFKVEGTYYKVSPKVEVHALDVAEVARLPLDQRLSILLTVASALKALHNASIVHGDLSPGNILLSRAPTGFKANVIDFDSSYLSGDPPPADEMMGNPPFYSPELLSYIQETLTDPKQLTTKSDIFALGLVFSLYLFGELPSTGSHNYASEAVRASESLVLPSRSGVPAWVGDLVGEMLQRDPVSRPTMQQVQVRLKVPAGSTPPPPPPPGVSRVKVSGPLAEWLEAHREEQASEATPLPPTSDLPWGPTRSRVRYRRKDPT
jgi:serine/threonine protein kinase